MLFNKFQHPTINDDLSNKILSGRVKIKSDIQEFKEDGIIFVDGTFERVDFVIMATGYSFEFPFLDESVVKVKYLFIFYFSY